MAMAMELARVIQQERLAEAESRRRYKAGKVRAAQHAAHRAAAVPPGVAAGGGAAEGAGATAGKHLGAKTEWPVFSLRIGRFQLVAFRTVRL